jgi:hypothetical protein
MNLTGLWEGKYTYREGYPTQYVGRSEPFEFDIVDKDGTLSGTCIDELVKAKEGNESYIIGTFKQNEIAFKKRYKFHFAVDESGSFILDDKLKFDGVDYKGRLYKKFFSRKPYFSGEWNITCEFKDENNLTQTFICKGTWKMSKTR